MPRWGCCAIGCCARAGSSRTRCPSHGGDAWRPAETNIDAGVALLVNTRSGRSGWPPFCVSGAQPSFSRGGTVPMPITPLMPVYPRCGVRPVRGEGVYLYGERGEKYLDFAAGIAVNALGHGHPHLTKAIQEQAATLMHVSNLYGSPAGRGAGAADRRQQLRRHGVLHQFGRRGDRVRDQDRAPLSLRQRQPAAAQADHLQERLSRPFDRRDLGDRPAQDARRLRAAAAGLRLCEVQRSRRRARRDRRRDRGLPRRDGAGRGRDDRGHARIHPGPAQGVRRARPAAGPRRDPVRLWPHRQDVGL